MRWDSRISFLCYVCASQRVVEKLFRSVFGRRSTWVKRVNEANVNSQSRMKNAVEIYTMQHFSNSEWNYSKWKFVRLFHQFIWLCSTSSLIVFNLAFCILLAHSLILLSFSSCFSLSMSPYFPNFSVLVNFSYDLFIIYVCLPRQKKHISQCFGSQCINQTVLAHILHVLPSNMYLLRSELLFIATDAFSATHLIRELSFQHVHFNLRPPNTISIPCFHERNRFECLK